MRTNILRNSDVNSIYIVYTENYSKIKLKANLRFLDTNECYLATEIHDNFKKPKNKLPAEIVAYTSDGIYKSQVKIIDCSFSAKEIVYVTDIPKQWNYIQLRQSSRKQIEADFKITFNDGFEIKSKIYDISLGAISFYTEQPINDLYTKIAGTLSIELPADSSTEVDTILLQTETKFLRMHKSKEDKNNSRYVYKFIELPDESYKKLKNYLIKLY